MNYNKVRKILSAQQGTQLPTYSTTFTISNGMPKSLPDATDTPIYKQQQQLLTEQQNAVANYRDPLVAARGIINGTHKVKNGKVVPTWKGIGQSVGNFVTNNSELIGTGVDLIGNAFNNGVYNNTGTETAFTIGDGVSNILGMINPAFGLAPKGIMAGIKGINNLLGKKTQKFSVDNSTIEQVGGSYGGSVADITNAVSKADTKYGLFSSGSRKRANKLIDEARTQQNILASIADTTSDQLAMINDLNYLNYDFGLSGGYNQRYMRAAKQGMKIQDKIKLVKSRRLDHIINVDTQKVEQFQDGGSITTSEIVWEPVIEEFKDGGSLEWEPVISEPNRTIEELIEFAKKQNPRFIQRWSEPLRYIKLNKKDKEGNTYWEHSTHQMTHIGNQAFPFIQEIDGKLLLFTDKDEALKSAIKNNNVLTFNNEDEAKLFAENYKQGWKQFFETDPTTVNPESEINYFKDGGTIQKNVIPEGALHKNKHHIENTEGLTQKGIPVIDNDNQQTAEVEREEIIFTLEVTKALEDNYHKYYNEETKQSEKDQLAIETGKLLVEQILHNTDDRAQLIAKCEKGGKL